MRKRVIETLLTGALALMLAFGGGHMTAHAESEAVGGTVLDEQMDSVAVVELQYTYNAATKTATITGNQSMVDGVGKKSPLPADTKLVVIKDATLSGNLAFLFAGLENLEEVEFENAKLTRITDLTSMFMDCKNLRSIDVGCFDTFACKHMERLFKGCISLEYIGHLDNLDMRNSNCFDEMFMGCSSLAVIALSQETPFLSVHNAWNMFADTTAEIIIPSSKNITTLFGGTFLNLTAESKVVIPDTVTEIYAGLGFKNDSSYRKEIIPGFVIYGSDEKNEVAAQYAEWGGLIIRLILCHSFIFLPTKYIPMSRLVRQFESKPTWCVTMPIMIDWFVINGRSMSMAAGRIWQQRVLQAISLPLRRQQA